MSDLASQTLTKKILILHPHFTIAGGAGNFVLEVGSRLAERGFEIIICSIRADPALISDFNKRIRFIDLGGPLSSSLWHWLAFPFFLYKVFKVCNSYKPDLLFPQVFPSNWWGFIYKLFYPKTKLLWMCQEPSAFIHSRAWIDAIRDPVMNFLLRFLNPLLRFIDCRLARQVDYVFANSNYGARYAAKIYGYQEERLSALYLGLNPAFALGDKAPSFKDRKAQIITVCRLTRFKNVNLIIEALSELHKSGLGEVELRIVGKGEEEQVLRDQVKALRITEKVHFCGALALNELVHELSVSRAFVLASVDEPFGLSVIEAMACGTPAVVVNNGGPSKIVENTVSGYHVEALNLEDLCSKLKILLQSEADFVQISAAARTRAKAFDWELTTDKIAQIAQKII